MKKQMLKQVCGLSIMVAGALVPLSSVLAAEYGQSRERFEPLGTELYSPPVQSSGAQGPIRTDASMVAAKPMTPSQERFEPMGSELYNPPVQSFGAQGPIRDDVAPETRWN